MKRRQTNTPTTTTTRDYLILKDEWIWCYSSKNSRCHSIPSLVSPKRAFAAHDEELMRCTKEINAVLRRVIESNSRKDVDLHLLKTPRGFLLAWANCDGVTGDDDPAAINKALRL